MPITVSKDQKQVITDFDEWTKTRLSKNFIMRDFLFSARSEILELNNRPSDDPDMVLRAGKALCERVLEPVYKRFGRFAITYGYQSREGIEAGYPAAARHSSAPHQWDRHTFGEEVYARVDILPFCVEDGEVSRQQFAEWIMMNCDIDLLMQWRKSNVYCITISPKPRRVWLEWVKHGEGDGGGNSITYWGEYWWKYVYPDLDVKPAFGPSETGGSMKWY